MDGRFQGNKMLAQRTLALSWATLAEIFSKLRCVSAPLLLATALLTLTAASSTAQSADETWRRMYSHLQCTALAEGGLQDAAATAHFDFTLQLLDGNPTLFSERVPGFVKNGSEADMFGRPDSEGFDPRVQLGRIYQIIAERSRFDIDGPPEEYPEGMTVSPSLGNEVVRRQNFVSAYVRRGCSSLCKSENIDCGDLTDPCFIYSMPSFCTPPRSSLP